MNNFIKLSKVKEQKLLQEEMKRINGGQTSETTDPSVLDYGVIPPYVLDYGVIPPYVLDYGVIPPGID
jgi:hypothetical protein